MSFFRIERKTGTYSPASAVVDEAATILAQLSKDERIFAFTCRVRRVADGTTATISFGRTGAVTAYMLAADVATRVIGKKTTSAGADLAGNGTLGNGAGAGTNIVVAWTHGDATVAPILSWCALIVREETWLDHIVQ